MAKSAGEFLRISLLQDKGYDPLAYRYLCLTAHYRTQMNFSWEALDAATTALERMRKGIHALPVDPSASPDPEFLDRFTDEINSDLNLPRALAVAWELLRGDLADPAVTRATLIRFDAVFGLGLAAWTPREDVIPPDVQALAEARSGARANKAWSDADRLRGELAAAGWEMEDLPGGYKLKRLKGGPGVKP